MKRLNSILLLLAALVIASCVADGVDLTEPEQQAADIIGDSYANLEPIPPSDGSEEPQQGDPAPEPAPKLQPAGCLPNDWAYSSAAPIDAMTVSELLGVRAIAYYSDRPGAGTEPIWAQREAWIEDGQVSAPCEGAESITFVLP